MVRARTKRRPPRPHANDASYIIAITIADVKRVCIECGITCRTSTLLETTTENLNEALNSYRLWQPLEWGTPPSECKQWASTVRSTCEELRSQLGHRGPDVSDLPHATLSVVLPYLPSNRPPDSPDGSAEQTREWRNLRTFAWQAGYYEVLETAGWHETLNRAVSAVQLIEHVAMVLERAYGAEIGNRGGKADYRLRDRLIVAICNQYEELSGSSATRTENGPAIRFTYAVLQLFAARLKGNLPPNVPEWARQTFHTETIKADSTRLSEQLKALTPAAIQGVLRKQRRKPV